MRLIYQPSEDIKQCWNLARRKMVLGRDPTCDIVIQDRKASRIHAEIVYEDGKYALVDKNSTNGSYVNGLRATRQVLAPGDVIILGASTLTVIEGTDVSCVEWVEEDQPQISAQVPLDALSMRISEISGFPLDEPTLQNVTPEPQKEMEAASRTDTLKTQKLLKNLHIVYELSKAFTSVMMFKELYSLIEKYIYDIFPEVERFCILTLSEDAQRFNPNYLSARHPDEKRGFEISRTLFNLAIRDKVSILTVDAVDDSRFGMAESVVGINLRSCMCAPLALKDKVIGILYCDNRTQKACFDNEDLELLSAMANQIAVALSNAHLYEEVQRAYHEAILALINAIEAKDPYTIGHTQRTSRYALGVAQELGLSENQCQRLKTAAELHDIGKIGIREKIMTKPSALSGSEYHTIQEHVIVGEKILKPITYLQFVLPIIRGHHENFDGSGYPDGLKGEDILLESRILAVADSFDAMTTQRPYNAPMSFAEGLEECKKKAGVQFDPKIVEALERFISANFELSDSGLLKKLQTKGETVSPFE